VIVEINADESMLDVTFPVSQRHARGALRFMSANIYNNLFNAILQPIRYIRVRGSERRGCSLG
jgi:hypothetical protein